MRRHQRQNPFLGICISQERCQRKRGERDSYDGSRDPYAVVRSGELSDAKATAGAQQRRSLLEVDGHSPEEDGTDGRAERSSQGPERQPEDDAVKEDVDVVGSRVAQRGAEESEDSAERLKRRRSIVRVGAWAAIDGKGSMTRL